MKLGMVLGYSGAQVKLPMDLVFEAERLGFDSVWSAEAWGADAVSPVAWVLAQTTRIKAGTAVMQMAARTPSMTAMTAMTLDQLSGGRFMLGIGPSGPQVIEGWYGQPYGKPLLRTREYIAIIRQIFERKAPLKHHGEHYQIPYTGPGAMGLGKPLKSILHGNPNIPIYMGVATEKGINTAAEIADGCFMIWANPDRANMFALPLDAGFAAAGGDKGRNNFDFAPFVRMAMGPDLKACRDKLKHHFALYIGGMGAREKNFYNDYTRRLGYVDAAVKIQDLYLAGRKEEAEAAVPDAYIDECCLVGPAEHIREQLTRWKAAGERGDIGTMVLSASSAEELRVVAEAVL
ncbi:MAG: LLM class F420-dependent oxidoreductase [Proteobacteria bacterium]|nr:LLM class F420-dependent oxidoreductase [Pseudomonadota bacterium]